MYTLENSTLRVNNSK